VQLQAVHDAARDTAGRPDVHVFDDFAIYNGRCVFGMTRQLLRWAAQTTRQRLRPVIAERPGRTEAGLGR